MFLDEWTPPQGWTGPESVHYWSFDTLNNVAVIEEGGRVFDALVAGQVPLNVTPF